MAVDLTVEELDQKIARAKRRLKFHRVTNRWIVEVVRKLISILENRISALDARQDEIIEAQNKALIAIEKRREQAEEAARRAMEAAKDRAEKEAERALEAVAKSREELTNERNLTSKQRESLR